MSTQHAEVLNTSLEQFDYEPVGSTEITAAELALQGVQAQLPLHRSHRTFLKNVFGHESEVIIHSLDATAAFHLAEQMGEQYRNLRIRGITAEGKVKRAQLLGEFISEPTGLPAVSKRHHEDPLALRAEIKSVGNSIRRKLSKNVLRDMLDGVIDADSLAETAMQNGAELQADSKPPRSRKTKETGIPVTATETVKRRGQGNGRDSTGQYLYEIGRIPLIDADKEKELAKLVEAGFKARAVPEQARTTEDERAIREGAHAKDLFIQSNLRLVVSIARRHPLPRGMDLLDLVQEGNLGLEHAVDKFNWRRGYKFSTYATFWIRQSIGRAMDVKGNLIRLPSDRSAQLRSALRDVKGEGNDLNTETARLHRLSTPTSLDAVVASDGAQSLGDFIPDSSKGVDDLVMDTLAAEQIHALLNRLEPRQRLAVEYRFGLADGEKHTYKTVGEILGVTAEGARKIVKLAISDLKADDSVRRLL